MVVTQKGWTKSWSANGFRRSDLERGVWTVRPDALFTKYHVRIVRSTGALGFLPWWSRRPVCISSLVASLDYFLEKIEETRRWNKPVSGNLYPSRFQGCRSTHMTVFSIPRPLVWASIPIICYRGKIINFICHNRESLLWNAWPIILRTFYAHQNW